MSSIDPEIEIFTLPSGVSVGTRLSKLVIDEIEVTSLTISGTVNGQPVVGSFVFTDSVQTLSNKCLDDTTTKFCDTVDPTIQVCMDAAGTTGTSSTLQFAQTANRVYTFPDSTVDANVVLTEGVQTINGAKTISNLLTLNSVANNNADTRLMCVNAGTNAVEYRDVSSLPHPVSPITTLTSAGGTTLVNDGIGPALAVKGLTAGTNITVVDSGTFLTINSTSVDATLASAGGTSLVNDGVGPALAVKGLAAGVGIAVVDSGTLLTITATATATSLASAGGTQTLVVDGAGPTLSVKGLTAGAGITLTPGATDITIASTAIGTGTFETSAAVVRPATTSAGYNAASDFVFGSQQLNDVGNTAQDSRIIFDKSVGFFAAGIADGVQWDSRGSLGSAVFGSNNAIIATAGAGLIAGSADCLIHHGGANTIIASDTVNIGSALFPAVSVTGCASIACNGGGIDKGLNCAMISSNSSSLLPGSIEQNTLIGTRNCTIGFVAEGPPDAIRSTIIGSLTSVIRAGDHNTIIGNNQGLIEGAGATAIDGCLLAGVGRDIGTARISHDNCFVWCDASPRFSSAANEITFGCSGGMRVFTNQASTTGVTIALGASAWAAVSDVNMKDNLVPITGVLERVEQLPIYEYNYKGQPKEVVNRGPTAQDWHKLFPSEKDPLRIDTMDLDGVALGAIRELSALVRAQSERLDSQQERLDSQQERLDSQQERLNNCMSRCEAFATETVRLASIKD